jgi:hypothetical protein
MADYAEGGISCAVMRIAFYGFGERPISFVPE